MKKIPCLILCLILICVPVSSGCGILSGSKPPENISASGAAGDTSQDPDTQAASSKTEVSIHYPEPLPHEGAADSSEQSMAETPEESQAPEETPDPAEPPGEETAAGTIEQTLSEPPIGYLRQQTEALVASYGGTWSVFFERTDTGESFTIHDGVMISASLIKLYVYGTVMEQIETGELPEGVYEDYLWDMIVYSDNDSCNILIDAVGGFDAVNAFIAEQGFTATELNRKMLDWNGLENYTSASDCGHLLKKALSGAFVSEQASGLLLEMMRQQSVTLKIPAGVPEGIITGNKTGELINVENDAAFIESPACTYILCVMTEGVDSGTAIGNINELSYAVYSLLNTDSEGEET